MRIVAIIIQPPRLLDTVPGLLSNRTVAWSESCRSRAWSTVTSWETLRCMWVAAVSTPGRCQTGGRPECGQPSGVKGAGSRSRRCPPRRRTAAGGAPRRCATRRRCRIRLERGRRLLKRGTGGRRPGSALDVLLRGEQREFVRPRERLPVTGDGDREGAGDRGGGQSVAGIPAKEAGGEIAGDERVARADGVDRANRHRGHLDHLPVDPGRGAAPPQLDHDLGRSERGERVGERLGPDRWVTLEGDASLVVTREEDVRAGRKLPEHRCRGGRVPQAGPEVEVDRD